MAKKKVKSSSKSSRKSHGELFDKHPNLIWLLPIFLVIAAVAVVAYNNSMKPMVLEENMVNVEQIPQVDVDSTETPQY